MLEPEHLQSMLDDAWDAAPDGEGTLRGQLRVFEKQDREALDGGEALSISANGHSSSFSPSGFTLAEKAKGWRHLINQFDRLYSFLDDKTDQAVYESMKIELVNPIVEIRNDYSQLRRV